MNPYDKVRELVEAIKSSEEVKTYLNLKKRVRKCINVLYVVMNIIQKNLIL